MYITELKNDEIMQINGGHEEARGLLTLLADMAAVWIGVGVVRVIQTKPHASWTQTGQSFLAQYKTGWGVATCAIISAFAIAGNAFVNTILSGLGQQSATQEETTTEEAK